MHVKSDNILSNYLHTVPPFPKSFLWAESIKMVFKRPYFKLTNSCSPNECDYSIFNHAGGFLADKVTRGRAVNIAGFQWLYSVKSREVLLTWQQESGILWCTDRNFFVRPSQLPFGLKICVATETLCKFRGLLPAQIWSYLLLERK